MKQLKFILLVILFSNTGCQKDNDSTSDLEQLQPATISQSQGEINNINASSAWAGPDIYLVHPVDTCTLKGSAQYPETINTIEWKKVSGPASFQIKSQNTYNTLVSNLEIGNYEFELRLTHKSGMNIRDTVSVFVLKEGSGRNEKIFKNLQWGCPMGCHMRIENFNSIVPIGIGFKVFVKRDNSDDWVEVLNMSQGWSKYVWHIYNNGLEILEDQTEYPEDTPDVKIVF